MNPFGWIIDKISDWVRWAFEGVYPVINDFWNMLYSTALNPFETPNGFTNLLMVLALGFIILFGFAHLIKNMGQYTQKRMLKKVLVIVFAMIGIVLMSRLVTNDEKEITFNTSLIYVKSDVSINPSDKNPNITVDSLGYTTISTNSAFSEDPFSEGSTVLSADNKKRTSVLFFPSQSFGIKNSVKYTPNFALAVGIHPISVTYGNVGKSGVFLSQHDILGKTLPQGITTSTNICPGGIASDKDGAADKGTAYSTFGKLLDLENKDNRVQESKKILDSANGYKAVGCVENATAYRKDIIFHNEAETNKKASHYEVVSFYYPLALLANLGNIDISADIQSYKSDFLFGAEAKTGEETTAASQASPEEKARNELYANILKEIEATGYLNKDEAGLADKLSLVSKFNVEKKEANVFNTKNLATHITGQLNLIAENLKKIASYETAIKQNSPGTNVSQLQAEIKKLEAQNESIYTPLTTKTNHLLSVFSLGDALSLAAFKEASTETKAIKISSMMTGLSTNAEVFSDKEKRLIDLYNKVLDFASKYKEANSIVGNKTFDDVMGNFLSKQSTYGKNLLSGGDMVLKLFCSNDENLKKINTALKNIGASEVTDEVVKCSGGTGTIVDKDKLIDIFNSVVSLQNKKDTLSYVNLVTYYGRIFKSSDNSKLGTIVDTKYEDTLPVKIGNFTLVSPLYYYNKLINDDISGIPPFVNLKNIEGKVYMPEGVYDLKIGGIKSWYKDLDDEKGAEYANPLTVFNIPLLGTIIVAGLFLLNLTFIAGGFMFVISLFLTLIKD